MNDPKFQGFQIFQYEFGIRFFSFLIKGHMQSLRLLYLEYFQAKLTIRKPPKWVNSCYTALLLLSAWITRTARQHLEYRTVLVRLYSNLKSQSPFLAKKKVEIYLLVG